MMKRFSVNVLCSLLLLFLAGCSSSYYSIGQKNLEKENYDEAIVYFKRALEKSPDDPEILRELGIAYYSKPDMDNAIINLLKSFIQNPKDGRTLFYLGTAYEIRKDIPHALDMYRRFIDVNPSNSIRYSLEGRLNRLMRKQMEEEVASIAAQESSLDPTHVSDSTVAVLNFKNSTESRDLDPIQKGLTEMVITDLSKVKRLKVVERARMQSMVEEIGLGQTGLINIKSAPRVGRLLGAGTIVQGNFARLSQDRLQINGGLLDTKKRDLQTATQVEGEFEKFFQMEKELVFNILEKMEIDLSQEEIDAIEEIPTESMLAFMAYCKGLDYEDRGLFDEASTSYQNALQIDPGFGAAQKGIGASTSMSSPEEEIKTLEKQYSSGASEPQEKETETKVATDDTAEDEGDEEAESESEPESEPEPEPETETAEEPAEDVQEIETVSAAPATIDVTEFMVETGSVLDQTFLPGEESREAKQEESQNNFTPDILFEIRVPVPNIP